MRAIVTGGAGFIGSHVADALVARGLGVERVLTLNLPAIHDRLPDRTFLLDIDPGEAAQRIGSDRDRIEREDDGFREEVALAYRQLAETFPERIEVVDASRPPAETAKKIFGRVRDSL